MAEQEIFSLSAEQLEAFRRDGFVHIPSLFTPTPQAAIDDSVDSGDSLLAQLEAAFDDVGAAADRIAADQSADLARELARAAKATVAAPDEGDSAFTFQLRSGDPTPAADADASMRFALRHCAWAGGCAPTLERLGCCPRVLSVAAQLLGGAEVLRDQPQLEQLINQVHYKEPGDGVAFPWHQDSHHRGMATGRFCDVSPNSSGAYVQIVLAVDDVRSDCGPLGFIPGSHRQGHLGGLQGLDPAAVDASTAVFPLLKRGDAVAFGPFTIHGSEPNTGSSSRRTFINGFALPGALRDE